jgi:hypothetical protein
MTVKQKQCLLTFLGYNTGGVDGIWGDKSRNATEQCQEDLGIPADGVWGQQTETAVLEAVYTYDVDAPVPEADTSLTDSNVGKTELELLFDGIRYWSPEEFRCRCGEYHAPYCDGFPVLPDRTLLELVDDLRHNAGRPGHRSSGIRCYQHNIDQGGVADSRHLKGKALDFFIEGMTGNQLLKAALADPRTRYAYIIEGQWVHVDVL